MTKTQENDQMQFQATASIERDWALPLTVDQVLRGQGADPQKLRQRRPALVEIAAWALQEGLPLLQPVVLAQEFQVQGIRHESDPVFADTPEERFAHPASGWGSLSVVTPLYDWAAVRGHYH